MENTNGYGVIYPTMKRLEGEVIEGRNLFTQEEGKSYEVSSTVANIIENKLLNLLVQIYSRVSTIKIHRLHLRLNKG